MMSLTRLRVKMKIWLGQPHYRSPNHKFLARTVPLSIFLTTIISFWILAEAKGSGGLSIAPQKPGKAKLVNGRAIPPTTAPKRVKAVIEAANKIRKKPYIWGGGHGSFKSAGYDCSGAVSYALRGGRFIGYPMASGPLMSWGKRGKGKWITVYSNPNHVYLVVAGLRFDTANTAGNGPRWSASLRSTSGAFVARTPKQPGY
jgi:hypothetical protein